MIINIKIVVNIRLLDAKYLYSIQGVQFDFIQDSGLNILDYEMNGGVLQELFGLG